MPIMKFNPTETLTPELLYRHLDQANGRKAGERGVSTRGAGHRQKATLPGELQDQFIVFQVNAAEGGQTVLEASEMEPSLEGSDTRPDVLIDLQLQSFHLGQNTEVDAKSHATMRLVIGKDKSSRDRFFENVFWTVNAGLSLYDQDRSQPARPDQLQADITQAFGNRPVEIPGGLANMTFEVIMHKEPAWWKRIFSFVNSDTGRTLTSLVGFPAISHSAIQLLDEVFDRFNRSKVEVLFESRPMILALSKLAKQDYTGGNPRIRMGCLNPGFCIMARGRDYTTLSETDAYFYPHYGILAPSDVHPGDVAAGNYEDPFRDITYAVFKVGMQATNLKPALSFGGAAPVV